MLAAVDPEVAAPGLVVGFCITGLGEDSLAAGAGTLDVAALRAARLVWLAAAGHSAATYQAWRSEPLRRAAVPAPSNPGMRIAGFPGGADYGEATSATTAIGLIARPLSPYCSDWT